MRRVAVLTLGCKLNQADSEALARELIARGLDVIDRPAAADAYVINTCSVTHVADRKARKLVHAARRLSPNAHIIVTGCYADTAGAQIADALGADAALPTSDKPAISALVASLPLRGIPAETARAARLRTRSFVKVQSGCNDVCAFCIVPRTRGREASVEPEHVVAAVREREGDGVQEVVLTGTQLGAYGRDAGRRPADVIRAVLEGTSVPRIRFSSLQPQDITPELLALWDDPRLCRHFHLALQSGCDATLRRMRRRYTTDEYGAAVARIRALVHHDAAITTDIIVGFPGETDGEFERSAAFASEMQLAAMHVFPYSRRSGTTAVHLADHVPPDAIRSRMSNMLAVAGAARRSYLGRFAGRVMPVLWEERADGFGDATASGLTDNYIRVRARDARDLRNTITPARLLTIQSGGYDGQAL